MKYFMVSLLVLLITNGLGPVSGRAFAGQKTEEIQGRQDIQYSQIQQGIDNGSVSQHEAKELMKGQKKINKTAHQAMKDDKLTRREFHKLEHMQNKESQNIDNKAENSK